MATVMRIDLRGEAPYYTLTRDADSTVYVGGSVGQSETPGAVSGGGDYGNSVAATRQEILDNLAAERESVFAGIRGDNAGPIVVLRVAPLDDSAYYSLLEMARQATSETKRREYLLVAELEHQFALDIQAAQQVVQDAVTAGAEWIIGDATYLAAKMERGQLAQAAIQRFNQALPVGSSWPQKVYSFYSWGA